MAQRQDDAGHPQCDVPCHAAEQTKIDERVEDLPGIAKARHVERHIAQPQCTETECLGQLGTLDEKLFFDEFQRPAKDVQPAIVHR